MIQPENSYMCQQFCAPDGLPPKCLLSNDRNLLADASQQPGEFDKATLDLANRISDVCQLVKRQLDRVDEFRN